MPQAHAQPSDEQLPLRLFVANSEANSVSIADLGQGHSVRTVGVGQAPSDMVNSADGTALFVTLRRDDALGVIDTIEGRLRARVAVARRPVHVYRHPAG